MSALGEDLRAAAALVPPHRTKLLVRNANRNFIVDAQDVIYATVDNGMITQKSARKVTPKGGPET